MNISLCIIARAASRSEIIQTHLQKLQAERERLSGPFAHIAARRASTKLPPSQSSHTVCLFGFSAWQILADNICNLYNRDEKKVFAKPFTKSEAFEMVIFGLYYHKGNENGSKVKQIIVIKINI